MYTNVLSSFSGKLIMHKSHYMFMYMHPYIYTDILISYVQFVTVCYFMLAEIYNHCLVNNYLIFYTRQIPFHESVLLILYFHPFLFSDSHSSHLLILLQPFIPLILSSLSSLPSPIIPLVFPNPVPLSPSFLIPEHDVNYNMFSSIRLIDVSPGTYQIIAQRH